MPVTEPVQLGRGSTICGNCHHKGHRNDARHACEYVKCVGFHYCGYKKFHPEHTQLLSDIKKQIKRVEQELKKGNETLKTITDFESKSETYFFAEMTPRLKSIDTTRYQNKLTLFKDLRILKAAFNSKVPEVKPNDKAFIRSTLDREKSKIRDVTGESMLGNIEIDIDKLNEVSPIKHGRTGSRKRALSYGLNTLDDDDTNTSSSDWSSSDSFKDDYDKFVTKSKHNSQRHRHRRIRKDTHKRKHRKQLPPQDLADDLNEKEPFTQAFNINNQRYLPVQAYAQNSDSQQDVVSISTSPEQSPTTSKHTLEHTPAHDTIVNMQAIQSFGNQRPTTSNSRVNIDTLLYAANMYAGIHER